MDLINPPELGQPRGWTNGVVAPAGSRMLFVAGQTAADGAGRITASDFAGQFDAALAKTLTVVRAAGGTPHDVVSMTIYVSDLDAYRAARPAIKDMWRARLGTHYPAMALVEVCRLLDEGALVEIEAVAALPDAPRK